MHTVFKTTLDDAKKFMNKLTGLSVSTTPNVGDLVQVYRSTELEILLTVIERKWVYDLGYLEIQLHLPCNYHIKSVAEFMGFMRDNRMAG